jgi:hypothetical protein
MWVALFINCMSPMAADCSFGAKTDRFFVDQKTCEAFVTHAEDKVRSAGVPVSHGFCVEMDGKRA